VASAGADPSQLRHGMVSCHLHRSGRCDNGAGAPPSKKHNTQLDAGAEFDAKPLAGHRTHLRARSPVAQHLPSLSLGIPGLEPLLCSGWRRTRRGQGPGTSCARDDLPRLPARLSGRRQLLPRRRRGAGALWPLWRGELDPISPEDPRRQDLPRMWDSSRTVPFLLPARRHRARRSELKHPRTARARVPTMRKTLGGVLARHGTGPL
jgi:hypothetical protein